ncbi:MAG: sulfotransferase [Phycisphaeraceae bacterium]|nr:MAG: sulfotransferase [Phycisphaeraceae bacterium]
MPRQGQPIPPAVARQLYEANALKMKYRLKDAAELYKTILAEHPRLAPALAGLGHTVGVMGKIKLGIDLLRESLSIDPDAPPAHLFIAELIFRDHDPETALTHLDRTLAAEPKNVDALVLAAGCLERLNRIPEARAFAERAVAAKRNDAEANLTLATLEARAKETDAARARLEKIIARSTTPPDIHHRALTEMGFLLDKAAEYDAAFDAFDRAGREIAQMPEVKRVNADLAFLRLNAYRGRLSGELLGRFRHEPFDTPAPAFLVGFPRSGTTMTEQILAAHPRIATSDEQPLLDPVGKQLMEGAADRLDVPARLAQLDLAKVAELRRTYWENVAKLCDNPDGRLFVDKLPLNILDLGMINAIFPDARVIVALRDPRDVCLSCFMQWFAPNPAMVQFLSLPATARFYDAVMSLYLESRDLLTVRCLQIRYEDTVADLESQGRRLIDHLGLEWSDDLLRFQDKARERAIRTPSYAAVTEKVHTRAVGRWRNYASHFAPLHAILNPCVSAFGYEPGPV